MVNCGPDESTQQGSLLTGETQDVVSSIEDVDKDQTTHSREPTVIDYLNTLRTGNNLPEILQDPLLTLAAQNHADYLFAHPEGLKPGQDPHLEDPEEALFTGIKVQQRVEYVGYEGKSLGENIALRPTAEAALQSWLETLYSRLPLMDLALEEIGLGQAGPLHERVFVLVAGTQSEPLTNDTSMRVYPAAGSQNITTNWSGNELPQPTPPPAGYPSGPVISLHTAGTPFDGVAGVLRSPEGQKVPCSGFTIETDPNLPQGVAAIIPHEPLEADSLYSVTWKGSISGTAFSKEHAFETGGNNCEPVSQDCGHGRACYIQQGKDICLWVGPLEEGEECLYINDCSRGFGCYGLGNSQLCRRYCALNGPINCQEVCSGQYSVLDDEANTGFCWNVTKD